MVCVHPVALTILLFGTEIIAAWSLLNITYWRPFSVSAIKSMSLASPRCWPGFVDLWKVEKSRNTVTFCPAKDWYLQTERWTCPRLLVPPAHRNRSWGVACSSPCWPASLNNSRELRVISSAGSSVDHQAASGSGQQMRFRYDPQ